jgi:hypothetical protein
MHKNNRNLGISPDPNSSHLNKQGIIPEIVGAGVLVAVGTLIGKYIFDRETDDEQPQYRARPRRKPKARKHDGRCKCTHKD